MKARNTTSVRPFIMSRTSREVLCRATESLPRAVIGLELDYFFLKGFLLFRDEARLVKAERAWYRYGTAPVSYTHLDVYKRQTQSK